VTAVIPALTPAEVARFYGKLHPGGCGVTWAGETDKQGYGRFAIYRGHVRIRIPAHRLAYKLATGDDPGERVIRQQCETPPCCTAACFLPETRPDKSRAEHRAIVKFSPRPAGPVVAASGDASWRDAALCAQSDPEAWFPEKGGSSREAKAVCRMCLVRADCLEYALDKQEKFGIWGGMSERERRRIKRQAVA
jgi:WhiB family redox-sensing transcriptional regulator